MLPAICPRMRTGHLVSPQRQMEVTQVLRTRAPAARTFAPLRHHVVTRVRAAGLSRKEGRGPSELSARGRRETER